MKFNVNGLNLHVADRGNAGALPIVFLHFWGGSSKTWTEVVEHLPSQLRPIAIDLRGWGDSESPKSEFSLADFASDVSAVVAALALDRYVLVGHSMGGKIAQHLAAQRPKNLKGLVLVAPAPPGPLALPPEVRSGMAQTYDAAANFEAAIDNVGTAKRLKPEVRARTVADGLRGSPGAKYAWPHTTSQEDIRSEVTRIESPTLVIVGELDKIEPVDTMKREVLSSIRHAELKVIPATGHFSPLESPNEVADLIKNFVSEIH
jgi:pimeloyl-ACP methyl ester carboxylesterase